MNCIKNLRIIDNYSNKTSEKGKSCVLNLKSFVNDRYDKIFWHPS